MKNIGLLIFGLFLAINTFGQGNIQLNIRWNIYQDRYEVYAKPNFTQANFVWGPSQISVVLPNSAPNQPLVVSSFQGGSWVDDSRVYSPAAQPANDFHVFGSNGAFVNLTANVETLILAFNFSDFQCRDGVRLFNNGIDPSSMASGMLGGDFSNSISNKFAQEVYASNYFNAGTSCNPIDTDGDGVPDTGDAFPTDPTRAFISYTPSSTTFSSLAYEDSWPALGDYDFNDLVLNYQFQEVLNAQNMVVDIKLKCVIKAAGASYRNGWGFQLPIAPSSVKQVSGLSLKNNYITLSANGTEAGQTKAVIVVFDNAFDHIKRVGGTFVNTVPNQPYSQGDTMSVWVELNSPIAESALGTAPYNPFLIVNEDRGREAHLPNYPPTDKVNQTLFGTLSDRSNPIKGVYYKNVSNLPWAIHLPVNFDYPTEKTEIIDAHLYFKNWAESGGTTVNDWFLNKTGYRNNQFIYKK